MMMMPGIRFQEGFDDYGPMLRLRMLIGSVVVVVDVDWFSGCCCGGDVERLLLLPSGGMLR